MKHNKLVIVFILLVSQISFGDGSNWEYYDDIDGIQSHWATTRSNERKDFGSPYHNVQQKINITKMMENRGFFITVSITEGQYQGYTTNYINVKFDNGSYKKYKVEVDPEYYRTLHIKNATDFLKNLKGSSRVLIESHFYKRGKETFTFDTDDLDWNE
jgi:hypothetical protein